MSIEYQVLGRIFLDNALWVRIQTGQSIHRLLFDCGESVLYNINNSELQNTEHLFFSHCHMDHIAGFDTFCRLNYNRPNIPVCVWGPQDITHVISHRLQGFTWNLISEQPGRWQIHEIKKDEIQETNFYTSEAFSKSHYEKKYSWNKKIFIHPNYEISAILLNHGISSIGYIISEPLRWNIDKDILQELKLSPGPWLNLLKDYNNSGDQKIVIENNTYSFKELRQKLLKSTPGETLAYLTDFVCEENTQEYLADVIPHHATIICESQYRHQDLELAKKNFHLTSIQAAQLAKRVSADKLILFHISQRYNITEALELLNDSKNIFPSTYFPQEWGLK